MAGLGAAAALVSGAPESQGEEQEPRYTVKDLGPGTPTGLNDAGQVVVVRGDGFATDPSGGSIPVYRTFIGSPGSSPLEPYRFDEVPRGTNLSLEGAGISNAGVVAGSAITAFRRQDDSEDLTDPGYDYDILVRGFHGSADGVSLLGVLTGSGSGGCDEGPKRWYPFASSGVDAISPSGGMAGYVGIDYPDIPAGSECMWPGDQYSQYLAYVQSRPRGRLWQGGIGSELAPPEDAVSASVEAIGDSGVVVGTTSSKGWSSSSGSLLGGESWSAAYGVNGAGTIVGHDGGLAAILRPGSSTLLPAIPGDASSAALDVNDDGDACGFAFSNKAAAWTSAGAFVLDDVVDNGITRPEPPHDFYFFHLDRAVAINATGQILCLGFGNSGSGGVRSYLLTPICAGLQPSAQVIDFGEVEVGFVGTGAVTIRNCTGGAGAVTMAAPMQPFRRTGAARANLAMDGEARFELSFSPKRLGPAESTIEFAGPAGSRRTVRLVGTGIAVKPKLLVIPGDIGFPSGLRGTVTLPVFVQSLHDKPMTVRVSALDLPFTLNGPAKLKLAPQGTARWDVAYSPRLVGQAASAGLVFTTSVAGAPDQSYMITGGEIARTARVRRIVGSPELRKLPGGWGALAEGDEIGEGVELSTDPDSEVEIELPDGSVSVLRRSSHVKLAAYFKQGGLVSAEIELKIGELASKVNKSDQFRSDFKVRSPTAVAAVRGTEFTVSHDEATGVTTVNVTEGVVEVDPEGEGLRTVKVKAGRRVVVTPDSVGRVTRTAD